jgi:ABC-type transport system substrate-binding protein
VGQITIAASVSIAPSSFDPAVLRKGVNFHNGAPVTAEDAKLSFGRARWPSC